MVYGRRRFGCNWAVKWLYAALVAAFAVGCGDDEGPDSSSSGVIRSKGAVRPMAPLSGSISGSRQPVFSFTSKHEATVDICYDRSCEHVIESLEEGWGTAQPDTPLPAGTVFWRVVSGRNTSAVWQLVIPGRDSGLSTAAGTVPDYNGDGIADVAIGAPAMGSGSVPVHFGGIFGPSAAPDLTLAGGDGFGRALAAVGDVNGDGFVDLAVAAGGDPGSVTIYSGGPSGPGAGGGTELSAGSVTAGFGTTMASAGDVDGDGFGDVIVGGLEVAQVFRGGGGGIKATAAFTLAGAMGGDALVVQGPGDVNGDGAPDVYVGGALYLGSDGGFAIQSDFTPGARGTFAGDNDGDGLTDFAAQQAVYPGTPTGVDPNRILFIQAGEFVLGTVGDVDGDGYADVFSSISAIEGVPERERVYFGMPTSCGTNGCRDFAPLFITGHDQVSGNLRAIIAAAGDLNGDGGDDLVVATPETGSVYVYLAGGARQLPLRFPFPTLLGATGFGTSLAGLFGTAPSSL